MIYSFSCFLLSTVLTIDNQHSIYDVRALLDLRLTYCCWGFDRYLTPVLKGLANWVTDVVDVAMAPVARELQRTKCTNSEDHKDHKNHKNHKMHKSTRAQNHQSTKSTKSNENLHYITQHVTLRSYRSILDWSPPFSFDVRTMAQCLQSFFWKFLFG